MGSNPIGAFLLEISFSFLRGTIKEIISATEYCAVAQLVSAPAYRCFFQNSFFVCTILQVLRVVAFYFGTRCV